MKKLITILIGCLFLFALGIAEANPPNTPKKWTFLVFVNGKNNLEGWADANLAQMEKVGSNDEVNIVVQFATLSAHKTVRLFVKKGSSDIQEDLGSGVDMGDYHSLQDFIAWGVKNFPAEHYFIDVWNHGSGWHYSANDRPNLNDISYDEETGHVIKTEELGKVMASAATLIGHKVDLYGSDACLMAMAEVANEMSDSVQYFAGSEETEPAEGWPYDTFLEKWEATKNATAPQIAKILTDSYVASLPSRAVTFSAFDLNQIADLTQAIKRLGANINTLDKSAKVKILDIVKHSLHFYYSDYVDLLDFITRLQAAQIKGLDSQALLEAQYAVNNFVIANGASQFMKDAKGVAIWIPSSIGQFNQYSGRYSKLVFNTNTKWMDAVSSLLKA